MPVALKNSLKTRITVATLLIFLLSLWSLSYYAHRVLHDDIERLLGEQQYSTAKMIAQQVERDLDSRVDALAEVARLGRASMQAGPAAMQRFLAQRNDLHMLFSDGAFAAGRDGTAIAATRTDSDRVGTNYGDRDYLRGALKDGQPTIGKPGVGRMAQAQAPAVGIAVPMRDEHGTVIGALAGVTYLGVAGFLDEITQGRYGKTGGYVLVAPQHHLIVAASDKQRVLETLSDEALQDLFRRFSNGVDRSGVAIDANGVEVLYSAKEIPLAGWYAVVYMPTAEAFFPAYDVQRRLLIAAAVLTLLAGALTWWVLRRQLEPLASTARALAGQTLGEKAPQPLPIARPDEIGLLVGGFNALVDTLARREAARQESEEHFRLIFENSGDAIVFSSPYGPIESANPAACALFGYTVDEMRALGPTGVMDTSDPRLSAAVSERNRTGRFRGELRTICRDGRTLDVELTSTCFCDARGQIHTINQLRDISERKRSEDAIRLSEARLRRAELAARAGNWELHFDTGIMTASAGAVSLFGLASESAPGERVKSLLLPEYVPLHDAAMKRVLRNGEDYDIEFRIRTADTGQIRDIHAFAQYDAQSRTAFGIVQDISARKRSEARLQLAANVFTHVREGILIVDAQSTIVEVNEAFTRITGYTRAEAIGQSPRMLKSERQPPEFYAQMWRALNEQGYWSGEIWNRRKNGELYAQGLTISTVRDNFGQVLNYVGLFSDITETKALQEQLQRIAHYDALTDLPNRVLLADRLQQALLQCHRQNTSVAVVYLDLDDFKAVNDTHGHGVGDALLVAVAQRMQDALRESDTLSRIGGDEFVAVLVNLAEPHAYRPAIERLLHAAASPVAVGGLQLQVSVSIGVTLYPQDQGDADLLMRHADQALYVAKQMGKNRFHVFDVAHDTAVNTQRAGLQHIRDALEQQQFMLLYQPKVNMRSGRVIGAEALIRWRHPERGVLPPAAFLPLVENDALAVDIGSWVIDCALAQIEAWRAQGVDLPISVNVGARQLQDSDFVERLARQLGAHPSIRPGDLGIEVLESSALDDLPHVSQVIEDCQKLGVRFALDDFGTGYSSLTYLKRLPVSQLKIDQSFVRDMLDDPDDLAILEGVIGLATAFRRDLIAEGVETVEHGELLLDLGCECAQGYGIGQPMSAADLLSWASTWRPAAAWRNRRPAARGDLPLLFAAVEHRAWIQSVERGLADERPVPPAALGQCRFCISLAAPGLARHAGHAAYAALLRAHQDAHALAVELCADRRPGAPAPQRLDALYALRDTVAQHLHALRASARRGGVRS